MGSIGNTPWAPYNTYRDCSQEICSIYCPQYCYLIFPPPPSDDGNHPPFSPLIIAVISALATALLLVMYYTFATRFCRRRNRGTAAVVVEEDHDDGFIPDPCHVGSTGLDEADIKTIAVRKYRKGEMNVEGSECVVCLSEFQENEVLRVLPKCSHMFHPPCIDTWLVSSSVCPLCRANVAVAVAPQPLFTHQSPPGHTILVVDNQENRNFDPSLESRSIEARNEVSGSDRNWVVAPFRRSKSLGKASYTQKISSFNGKFEENFTGNNRSLGGVGGSKESSKVKRSFSMGRLTTT